MTVNQSSLTLDNPVALFTITNPNPSGNIKINTIVLNDTLGEFSVTNDGCSNTSLIAGGTPCQIIVKFIKNTQGDTASLTVPYIDADGNTGSIPSDTINGAISITTTGINYPQPSYIFPATVAIVSTTKTTPTYQGSIPTHYTITPALPVGLNMDPTSGIITGTPTTNQTPQMYTISAGNSNQGGTSQPKNVSTTISITISTSIIATITPDQPVKLTTTDNVATFTLTNADKNPITINTLPSDSTNFKIDSTPTSHCVAGSLASLATCTVTVKFVDTTPKNVDTYSFNLQYTDSLNVQYPIQSPSITGTATKYPITNLQYTVANKYPLHQLITLVPTTTGGISSEPITYSISPTTLPAGLSFSATTGIITGSPTATTTTDNNTFTVTAQNADTPSPFSRQIALNIDPEQVLTVSFTLGSSTYQGHTYTDPADIANIGFFDDEQNLNNPTFNKGFFTLKNNSTDTITVAETKVIETITNSALSFTVNLNSCITTHFNPGDYCTIPVQFNNANDKHFLPTDPSANLLHGIKLQLKTYDQTYGSQESLVYYSPTVNGKDSMWQCPDVSELADPTDATKLSPTLKMHWLLQNSITTFPNNEAVNFNGNSSLPGGFWLWEVYVNDYDQNNYGRVECRYADGNTDFWLISRNNQFNNEGGANHWWGDNHCGKIGKGTPFTTCMFGTIIDYNKLSLSN